MRVLESKNGMLVLSDTWKAILVAAVVVVALIGCLLQQGERNTLELKPGQSGSAVMAVSSTLFSQQIPPLPGSTSARPTRIDAPSFITVDVTSASTRGYMEYPVNSRPYMKYHSDVSYTVHVDDDAPTGKYPVAIIFPGSKCQLTVEVK